ncbi:MAG: hypothetical protein ABSB41_12490 [Anaerolineales bacterium]|jgi:hypothetical protein
MQGLLRGGHRIFLFGTPLIPFERAELGLTHEDVIAIADNSRVLPDYKNNPRIARWNEGFAMLSAGFKRQFAALKKV